MKSHRILLLGIFLLAIFFRFQNLSWDSGFHLHPDERFLTMVGNSMKIPSSLMDYFDPSVSTLNPANVGFGFFVYGVFPVVLNKILAVFFSTDNYNLFTIQGRILAGVADLIIVLLVYKTLQLLEKNKKLTSSAKYWGAFFYAIAVLPIQYAHFFTVDVFLNFFMFTSFYFALRYYYKSSYIFVALSALFLGLGIASKINAVLIVPLIFCFIFARHLRKKELSLLAGTIILFLSVTYFTVRVANPYYFQTDDFSDLTPSSLFIQNIRTLKSFEGVDVTYPPALQWINTIPFIFPALNLALFGLGVPFFLILLTGIFIVAKQCVSGNRNGKIPIFEYIAILFWILLFFIYQSFQFVKVMRYFIFLYPFFTLFSALAAVKIFEIIHRLLSKSIRYRYLFYFSFFFLVLFWPVIFSSIYIVKNTRVEASNWIYDNLPNRSVLLSEYWDDPLPLLVDNPLSRQFYGEQISIFDPETSAKWDKINKQLAKADYYVLSSNRGWGTIPAIPKSYPQTTKFYNDLFKGKLAYKKIKTFYPAYYPCHIFTFDCPRILSNWFDESFTVYDHPTVVIFKNYGKNN